MNVAHSQDRGRIIRWTTLICPAALASVYALLYETFRTVYCMMSWVTTSPGEAMNETSIETPKSLLEHISLIPDPRIQKKCRHKLVDIVAISVCAILCGADDWNAIEGFGKALDETITNIIVFVSTGDNWLCLITTDLV